MENVLNYIKFGAGAAGAFIGSLLGGADGMLMALVGFMAADYITGVIIAIIAQKLSSEVGFKGLFKKVMIFVLVGMAHTIDTNALGGTPVIRTAVIAFYLANEGISITENAVRLGLPLPKKLVAALEQLKDKSETEDNDNE